MERKQVSLDLGTPALQPNVQRAGQYSVAVAPTPKTNSALQLAQALRVTPQILGQASNIAKGMGAEAAASTMDVEAMLEDKETKGILGYNRAYQHGLVKRYFSMNEESIKERFMNVARDPESLKMTTAQFLGRVEEERQDFLSGLNDALGGNPDRDQAIQALTGTFVDDLRDAATVEWRDYTEQQTDMFASSEAQMMMNDPKKGVDAGLKYLNNELVALGVAPKLKVQKMRGAVEASIAVLLSEGKIREASKQLAVAQKYKIVGNATLFGSAEGKAEKVALMNSIERAASGRGNTDELAGDFAATSGDAYAGLRGVETIEDISPTQKVVMMRALAMVNPTGTEEEIEGLFNQAFEGNGSVLQNYAAILREKAVNGSDETNDMWMDSRPKLDYQLERIENRPLSPINLTEGRKKEALEEFTAWQGNHPDKDYRDWVKETQQPFKQFPELKELSAELTKGLYVKESIFYTKLPKDLYDIADNFEVEFNDTIITSIQANMEKALIDYAAEVAEKPDSLSLIENERKELFKDVNQRLGGLAKAKNISIDPLAPSKQKMLDETSATGGTGSNKEKYNSLKRRMRPQTQKGIQELNTDRQKMYDKRHLPQLGLSLTRFGFESYSPSNTKLMVAAGLDAGDVKLVSDFNELGLTAKRFRDVIEADIGLNTLSDAQKNIREEYQELGIYDLQTLEDFARSQESILNQ